MEKIQDTEANEISFRVYNTRAQKQSSHQLVNPESVLRRLRECENIEFAWELKQGTVGRAFLFHTRVSVKRASTSL